MNVAATVRTRIEQHPGTCISLREFNDLPRAAVHSELTRLRAQGVIRNIATSIYVPLGVGAISPYELLHARAAGRVYPIGANAAHALGLLDNSPAVAEYATTAEESFTMDVPWIVVRRRAVRGRASLSSPEAGLLEILPHLETLVPVSQQLQAADLLLQFCSEPQRASRLRKAALQERATTQRRLAALLRWNGYQPGQLLTVQHPGQLGPLAPQLRLPV